MQTETRRTHTKSFKKNGDQSRGRFTGVPQGLLGLNEPAGLKLEPNAGAEAAPPGAPKAPKRGAEAAGAAGAVGAVGAKLEAAAGARLTIVGW